MGEDVACDAELVHQAGVDGLEAIVAGDLARAEVAFNAMITWAENRHGSRVL